MNVMNHVRVYAKGLMNSRYGFCPVCNRHTLFLLCDDVSLIRNHALCFMCRSNSRNRHVALSILQAVEAYKISALKDISRLRDFVVFNTSSSTPVARALGQGHRNVIHSEYFDGCPSGEKRNGILCQNLEDLAFEPETIDMVISEDVFEHVKCPEQGFKEIYRVLKPGGVHIFTIPYFEDRKTVALFEKIHDDYVLSEPVEWHGDPVRGGIPAYWHIGYDVFQLLENIGFETVLKRADYDQSIRFGAYNSFTFVSKKPLIPL